MSAAEASDFTSNYYAWLNRDTRNRELHFQITCWVAKLRTKYSYVRIEALTEILTFMRTMTEEDQDAFIRLQNSMDENVSAFQTKPKETDGRVISTNELVDALDVIQGCCLIHFPSKQLIGLQCRAVPQLLELATSPHSAHVQLTALDCLLALMVDCAEVQNEFHAHKGLKTVVELLKAKSTRTEVRHKCAALLLFLTRYFAEREENAQRVQALLGDKLTLALTQSAQLTNRTQDDKFDAFLKQLDQAR